jgi:alpha-D-ribose 1-methylphosphonate 5-triphosphate synthase subunit PhnG
MGRLEAQGERGKWMSILAKAPLERLTALFPAEQHPSFDYLRKPETGLVMIRGRISGSGSPFNLGEAPVTRCSVRLSDGTRGDAYVMGRSTRHAEVAAVCDALLQRSETQAQLMREVIQPLTREKAERRREASRKSAATKVDFFTLVRGDD